jgi:hypothetical protein
MRENDPLSLPVDAVPIESCLSGLFRSLFGRPNKFNSPIGRILPKPFSSVINRTHRDPTEKFPDHPARAGSPFEQEHDRLNKERKTQSGKTNKRSLKQEFQQVTLPKARHTYRAECGGKP